MYETGGMRRLHLRGRENAEKRLLIQGAGFNIGLVLRKRHGLRKPRSLQGVLNAIFGLFTAVLGLIRRILNVATPIQLSGRDGDPRFVVIGSSSMSDYPEALSTTGC